MHPLNRPPELADYWPQGDRMPKIEVIVLNWNGLAWLPKCLTSVRRSTYANLAVTLVDNASSDGSPEVLASRFPELRIIRNRRNLGFAGGANVGLRHAWSRGADFALILNQDTWVDQGWLEPLVRTAVENPRLAILSPMQLAYDSDETDPLFGKFNLARARPLPATGSGEPPLVVEWVVGAAFMLRRSACSQVGHFDPLYFCYYEEMDLCRRMRFHGHQVAIVPGSIVHHHNSQIHAAERCFHLVRNRALYFLKDPRTSWWYKGRNYRAWWRKKPTGWPPGLRHRLRVAGIHLWCLVQLPRIACRLRRECRGWNRPPVAR